MVKPQNKSMTKKIKEGIKIPYMAKILFGLAPKSVVLVIPRFVKLCQKLMVFAWLAVVGASASYALS